MYFQPYGDEQQLNLNWIINEIINLHKQLDPDYETPSFTQVYPYSNLNRLNLDWVLSELKALKELAPEPTPELDIQAVAEALVALPFDSDTSYQIYDFISKDGEIWRATEAIAAGGVWDETKWFKTKIGTDLAVLERWINAINNSLTSLQNTVADLSSADISDDSNAGGATVKASLNLLKEDLKPITLSSYADITAFLNANYDGFARLCYVPAAFMPTLSQGKNNAIGIGYVSKATATIADLFLRTGYNKIWTIRVNNGATSYVTPFFNSNLITNYYEPAYNTTRTYAIGDIINIENVELVRVTRAISSGEAIVPGTNCDSVTIASLIQQLL